jgi:NitT/TauT family transport system ATP-binding protein
LTKLVVNNITKSFRSENSFHIEVIKVLENISFTVNSGEFITIFGPNGCGKSTLLNIISGILPPDIGEITIDNKPPNEVRIGYIFQNYTESLFPWNRVVDNI